MTRINWDGTLPVRRYAIFTDIMRGEYAIVVNGDDIDCAEKWGGFVSWLGGLKPAETRLVRKPNAEVGRGASPPTRTPC